uniref:Uncharacterized protein n=1 Tax=Micrurus carvalhoi TaxID=3147026 RepID=A0A2H6NA57_9SAUR
MVGNESTLPSGPLASLTRAVRIFKTFILKSSTNLVQILRRPNFRKRSGHESFARHPDLALGEFKALGGFGTIKRGLFSFFKKQTKKTKIKENKQETFKK